MALILNTNIENDADGYLVDAKNVKGSYIATEYESDLADLIGLDSIIAGTKVYVTETKNLYICEVAEDGTKSFVLDNLIARGYYNTEYKTFFKETGFINPIPASYNRLYIDITSTAIYYFKDATDRYVKLIEIDLSNYYTKTETDNLLDKKVEMALGTDTKTGDNYIEITKGLNA